MTILLFALAVVWTVAFVVYEKSAAHKPAAKGVKGALTTYGAPSLILFFAIYTLSAAVVNLRTTAVIIANPEVIDDAQRSLAELKDKRERDEAKQALKSLTSDDSKYAPIIGDADGKVVIYEFYDFNCGHCKRAATTLTSVLESEKDVKVVLKNFPIFPQVSLIPARASIAAAYQGKGAEMYKALFNANLVPELGKDKITEKDLNEKVKAIVFGVASKAGLDVERLKKDMEKPEVDEEILRTRQLAEKLKIYGTPAFIVGDQMFKGAIDENTMREAIEAAR
ncbi:MAG: DsbA family protein [Rickettsiales bacterium]|jgi:protein-disulfide isomerase|nr:DsbA family protein [Rickettsiales bacterium]